MNKKTIIALANMIRHSPAKFTGKQIEALADFCASQNPAFKRDRWLGYIAGTNGQNGGAVKP